MTKLKHPAQYSAPIVEVLARRLDTFESSFDGPRRRGGTYLDPFAGPGQSLPKLARPSRRIVGIELEAPNVIIGGEALGLAPIRPYVRDVWTGGGVTLRVGDARSTGLRARSLAGAFTSPCYGNRFSDHHNARDTSSRRSYTHDIRTMLGDPNYRLRDGNAGTLQFWTDDYRAIHDDAYRELYRVVKPGGIFLLNVSDFIEDDRVVHSATWHLTHAQAAGWRWVDAEPVETRRMRHGANREARVDREWVFEFRRPE